MYKKVSSGLIAITTTLVLGAATVVPVQADEVAVPVMNQADRSTAQNLPQNGQTQDAVRARLGAPQNITGPVGDPPISTWEYPEFIVYFEGQNVIHTVLKPNH